MVHRDQQSIDIVALTPGGVCQTQHQLYTDYHGLEVPPSCGATGTINTISYQRCAYSWVGHRWRLTQTLHTLQLRFAQMVNTDGGLIVVFLEIILELADLV